MSYEELLNERESLLKSIKEFENGDANTTTDKNSCQYPNLKIFQALLLKYYGV